MKYEVVSDPAEFERRTVDLLADEARHNLIRGILGNVIRRADAYADRMMFIVTDAERTVAAALMTAPYNLIVADTANPASLHTLAAGLRDDGVGVPGVIGNQPTVDSFVDEWKTLTGDRARCSMAQGVFALDRVAETSPVPGSARPGVAADAELLRRWIHEFVAEALPEEPSDDERIRIVVDRALEDTGPSGYWVWENEGQPVAMSGHGSPTGSGIRIGAVYTPRRNRRNGYASALVAAQSRWLLENGYRFCFLFTDLANPTSNAIYERIGYRQVAEAASYTFDAPASPAT
jgi:predicted GNAT family acetyltransferase